MAGESLISLLDNLTEGRDIKRIYYIDACFYDTGKTYDCFLVILGLLNSIQITYNIWLRFKTNGGDLWT